jgi:hypothetical protein
MLMYACFWSGGIPSQTPPKEPVTCSNPCDGCVSPGPDRHQETSPVQRHLTSLAAFAKIQCRILMEQHPVTVHAACRRRLLASETRQNSTRCSYAVRALPKLTVLFCVLWLQVFRNVLIPYTRRSWNIKNMNVLFGRTICKCLIL